MRQIFKFLSIFFLGIILSGCIDVNYKMTLQPDGSGIIEETVYMNAAMVQMIKGFMAMGNQDGEQEEFSLFDEVELRNEAMEMGEGVEYVSGEKLQDNGREGYKALYTFTDVNKIKMDQDVSDKAPSMGEEEEEIAEDDITFTFTKGSPATLIINMPEDKEDDSAVEQEEPEEIETDDSEEWAEQVKGMMKDFKILIQLEFDGDIIETNASYVEGSTITLVEMSFEQLLDDPEFFSKLKSLDDATYDETRDVLEELPGIKFETNEKVKVIFE